MTDQLIFTPSGVLALLSEIEELKDKYISVQENNGQLIFEVGSNSYAVDIQDAEEVSVDSSAVEEISLIDEDGFDTLEADYEEPVEGGLIKEIAKTLLVGGLVRLTGKVVKDYMKK